jgi:tetratricopeptide (TPR) repeat protein
VAGWWFQSNLAEARRAVSERQFDLARPRLERIKRLAAWSSGGDEVDLLLGDCELAAGRLDAAVEAWARIPRGSRHAEMSALKRGEAEMDRGRLADAESVFQAALRRPGPRAAELRHDLMQLFWQQGRLDEARTLIETNWAHSRRREGPDSTQAISNLRAHLSLDLEVYVIDHVQSIIDRAVAAAPDDHRVWLAQANLAIRRGKFDAARPWLDRCLASRPDDPVVWATALELALGAGDTGLASFAAGHLTEAQLPAERVAHTRAWFAARRGDAALEGRILEDHLAHQPGDTVAIERLAELETLAGHPGRALELKRRKTELDRARRIYATRVAGDFAAEARELAALAETLSRWFEARAFLAIVAKLHPADEAARNRLGRLERALLDTPPQRTSTPLSHELVMLPIGKADSPAPVGSRIVEYREVAEPSGLRFTFANGRSRQRQLPETMSGGVALLDYDADGWLDVYVVQGGPFPPAPKTAMGDRLFRNLGRGRFEDVTESTGLARMPGGYGHGAAVGDIDNDGWPDIFVTRFGSYALYRNTGNGRFEDVTEHWGLGGDRGWPTSAAFADLDGDGDLDLYVCHYVAWDPLHPRICATETGGPPSYCMPHLLEPVPDHVFRNDSGRFREVTREAGFTDSDGRGLGVLIADLDDDGRVDVFVANDGTANYLFRNCGGFRFQESALDAGVAASDEGGYQAGMGIACGDVDRDGRIDLIVTNFYGESSTLFRNLGNGLFGDHTAQVGLREATRYLLGFGTVLVDVNNDGHLDLATANGHVNDMRPVIPYAMPALLLLGSPAGRLVDISGRGAAALSAPRLGRGLAAGDLDNDGWIDLVLVDQDGPLAVLRNQGNVDRRDGHFVIVQLEGNASNRDGIGGRVIVRAGGRRQAAQRAGGGSYQSASDPRLHFGLGTSTKVDEIEVHWPSGRSDRYHDVAADTGYLLREGDPRPRPLKGFNAQR